VKGLAVVVAEKDGHVAMFRGASVLGLMPPRGQTAQPAPSQKLEQQQKEMLEGELRKANDSIEDAYNKNLRNSQQGVEVERTKK